MENGSSSLIPERTAPAPPIAMPFVFTVGYVSDAGLQRAENQDAVGFRMPHHPREMQTRGSLFVVCDGIGGFQGGRKASRAAVREFIRTYFAANLKGSEGNGPEQLLREALRQANVTVYEAARRAHVLGRMGTTAVAAVVLGHNAWVLNVGDSRAYLWRSGRLRQLSEDHVPKQRSAQDRRIERAVGTDEQVTPFVLGPVTLLPGDRLLLCTDGLTTAVRDSAISSVLRTFAPPEAARQLIERAKTGGASDNVSAVVVGVDAAAREDAGHRLKPGASAMLDATPSYGASAERDRSRFRRLIDYLDRLASSVVERARGRWAPWLYLLVLLLVVLAGVLVGRLIGG